MRNDETSRSPFLILALSCCWLAAEVSLAADWPTYRGDARRSGYTAEAPPGALSLRWTYKSRHAPLPAWSPRDTRMPLDRAFHPVIAGKTLFFGSSADCKVYALDAATGAERWEFFTGGPVRFAPAVREDRVLAVSDDGLLYCLAAADGKLLWKLRGGPSESMVLGNGRMVSRWPARGGPAIADGVVYWAAGIWPTEGIFIYAVDAASGKLLWCNDTAGSIVMGQPHGGAVARSGLSAQGNLVVADDRLLLPTGRAVPAALSRTDGKFQYFHLQRYGKGSGGGSEVVAADPLFFNGGCYFDVASGEMTGRGVDPATMAVTPEGVIYARGGTIFVSTLTQKEIADRKGNKSTVTALSKPESLVASPYEQVRALIVAGNTVVVGGENGVSVLDRTSKKTLLAAEVDGTAYGLAVADGRLYVSTDRAVIYCFDDGPKGEARVISPETPPASGADHTLASAAEEITRRGGVTEGYCLDLGCGDGRLAEILARRTALQVYAIDSDPKNVAKARERLDKAGLYGVRVTVHQGDPAATAYPNCFADLIVSGRSVTEGAGTVPAQQMHRLLRPFGGVACIGRPAEMKKTVRGPLDGAGNWTHQYCDPANTNCSTDTLARGPLGMLWFADFDFQMPSRHGRGHAPLVLDGRLFVQGVDALRCVDAYNGRTLWEYPLPGILKAYDQEHLMGTAGTGSNYCVTRDGIYLGTGGRCLRIDPADGKLLAELPAPKKPDGTQGVWGYIACVDGTLFGTLANTEHLVKWRFGRSDMSRQFTESILLFALDANSARLKWSYTPEHSIRNNAIAVSGGRVYLIDRELARMDDLNRGKEIAAHRPGVLIALDADTGQERWRQSDDVFGTMLAASETHNVLLMSYQDTRFKLDSEAGGRMAALRASDGKGLWDVRTRYGSRPIINGRTIYAQPGAWDLLTGRQKDFRFSRSYGCGILAGSRKLLVYRSATLGYTDLLREAGTENYGGIRPGCWINAIPAAGLVLMPDATDRCTCSYLIKSSIALEPLERSPTNATGQ
ncbi:MAG: outer membrane protein assembly factor BamB family protein [Planctomycetota bacterium]|jgi:outer membrane protein assembly factor BamB